MVSTYLGYTNATKDMTTTLNRVASQSDIKRQQAYYDANIGSVKTVDDFLNNYQIYSYAMTAYGLGDMIDSKAMMKEVLTSDLSDPNSFANKLSDPRYREFAAAFNFGVSTAAKPVQDTEQASTLTDLYTQSFSTEETDAATATSYYDTQVDKVKNVDQLLADPQLKDYVLKAYGIDPTYASDSYLKSVLTSDPNDPNSFLNKNGTDAYKALAAQFSFNSDGTISGATAQTAAQKAAVESQYNYAVPSFTTAVGAKDNTQYYQSKIGSITSVSQLTSDTRLFDYVKGAYGLDPKMSALAFSEVMASDPNDPTSFAVSIGATAVLGKFNFNADGSVPSGESAQTAAEVTATTKNYTANYDSAHQTDITTAVKNYTTRIAGITNIKDFFVSNASDKNLLNDDDPELYQMALQAYGIDPTQVSQSEFTKIVESDPYDPKSFVSSLKDPRYTDLAKAFDFDSSGKAQAPVQPLSQTTINNYVSEYEGLATIDLSGPDLTKAETDSKNDATYFAQNISKVTTVSDFLKDSKLVDFVLTANGIDPKSVTTDTLKKAFASDPTKSNSFINTPDGAQFKDIVDSFNFDTKGNLTNAKIGTAQDQGNQIQTDNLYLHQNLEEQDGETDEGVRLALYFQRNASKVHNMYDIMGDTALYQVITTTFSLPSGLSSEDTDTQAKVLAKYFDVKDLQDPTKVDTLLKRFSAMYDLQNSNGSSPALSILQGSSSSSSSSGAGAGVSSDTLLSIAQLSSR
ncbi:DUF1217 domain-containing protein [Rhizobium sp. BK376]|uniref:DUF1217 domain-containing protein n=1 Tax=Rhizobium sp. BK376 TaxID=2512149 RepID=UPI00104F0385|nr:DUF1217 domain-containing protein [Rhizobium sp. BK376]TCR91334.1 uncharacterized protein DUF1217 [Rhizobium sp. BK376]